MTRRPQRDAGMTLVEMLIVISLIGAVAAVIAATFATVLRVTPSTEFRIDDARSTRGLQTWLIRDIASTPPQAYDAGSGVGFVDSSTTLAGAGVPPGDVCTTAGTHVLFMAWNDGGVSYRAQYTIQGDGSSGFEMERTLCGADSGTQSVTGDLDNAACDSRPLSRLVTSDADGDGAIEAVVELCFVSTTPAGGLRGDGTSQEIALSVASRNGDTG